MKRLIPLASLLLVVPIAAASAPSSVESFEEAMNCTASVPGPARGSRAEQAGIRRFEGFLAGLNEKTAIEETDHVYARDAYLNDTLKTLHGAPAIRDYFLRTAKGLDSMTVRFDDLAVAGRDYYFRWTMDTRMKRLARGKTVRTIGVTLVRFDREGRVILHQDFWDSAQGVWNHVPLVGAVISWIKSAL
jgi:hypothetical protein